MDIYTPTEQNSEKNGEILILIRVHEVSFYTDAQQVDVFQLNIPARWGIE